MAEKQLKCSHPGCDKVDEVWSFQTSFMANKVYFCWEHLKATEKKVEERGVKNKFSQA